jgi:hypothetical protein
MTEKPLTSTVAPLGQDMNRGGKRKAKLEGKASLQRVPVIGERSACRSP